MLATRVASALVFGPLLISAAYFGGPLLWAVTALVVTIGLVELDRVFGSTGARAHPALTLPFGLALVAAAAAGRADLMGALLTGAVLTGVAAPAVRPGRFRAADGTAVVFAVVYVAWLGSHLILLRDGLGDMRPFFAGLIGTWVFDSASYFAGRAFGRRKLAREVSPGKTVEGLAGGLVFGLAAVTWLGLGWLELDLAGSFVLAAVIVTAAQLGDLAESALKRWSGIKDSGSVIPGHGGILDRFDSLLFVMPAVYYLWWLWLGAAGR